MFRGICTFTFLGLFITAPAWAQKPAAKTDAPGARRCRRGGKTGCQDPAGNTRCYRRAKLKPITSISPGELKATPEMWFYEQYMRQYQDPKMAVRANAEFQADQRQRRLEAMHWFGFSNSRPRACSDPYPWRFLAGLDLEQLFISLSLGRNRTNMVYRPTGTRGSLHLLRPEVLWLVVKPSES